ncbi:MAG TPA: YggT family protein [Rhodanobacteraceae bacterium]
MHPLTSALGLLVDFVFDALLVLFLARLFAELWRANFHNPISQFTYRYTNPVLAPLRRVLPNWRRWNLAAILIAWILELVKWLLMFVIGGALPHIGGWLVMGIGSLLDFALMMYVVLVFVWALASMFTGSGGYGQSPNPLMQFVAQLVEPPMRPLSKHMPSLGGIDFSPAVAILVLLLARILIADPILAAGVRMATGM